LLILVNNSQWERPLDPLDDCSAWCEITTDRARFREADAVVFHVPTLRGFRWIRKPTGQRWIAWSIESDVNYPKLRRASFLRHFDHTMTYRLDSDVPVPYLVSETLDQLRREPCIKNAEAPVACLISNGRDHNGRRKYIRELMRHIPVDSFGKVLKNKKLPDDIGRKTKLDAIAHYKFTLAFENSTTEDYVTEKFYDPLVAGSVPIYLGAPNVNQFAPGDDCFINASDFGGPSELAEYLMELTQDPQRYDSYLAWKHEPIKSQFNEMVAATRTSAFCRLCRLLRQA
jgi:hypothetical protein